jgi:MoaA/NifB/PqqE/SkfB family radical SAM enzyme
MDDLTFVWLEITGKCQLQCSHCYADSGPSGTHGRMSTPDWLRVIDQAAGLGVKRCSSSAESQLCTRTWLHW